MTSSSYSLLDNGIGLGATRIPLTWPCRFIWFPEQNFSSPLSEHHHSRLDEAVRRRDQRKASTTSEPTLRKLHASAPQFTSPAEEAGNVPCSSQSQSFNLKFISNVFSFSLSSSTSSIHRRVQRLRYLRNQLTQSHRCGMKATSGFTPSLIRGRSTLVDVTTGCILMSQS